MICNCSGLCKTTGSCGGRPVPKMNEEQERFWTKLGENADLFSLAALAERFKPKYEHKVSYCDHCERDVVLCGKCGNNTCNAGYGEVIGEEPGTMVTCDACPEAYEFDRVRSRH